MKKMIRLLSSTILLMLIAISCNTSSLPELHIFIWSDYIKPELIEKFKEKYHCQVIVDTYDSNESMYAKLKLGAGGYDILLPSNYFMELMKNQGMLQPLAREMIPNLKNLDPTYTGLVDPTFLDYGVPYNISVAGLAYRTDKVKDMEASWSIFGKSEYRGRMTMLNDIRETIGAALRFLGHSVNTLNPKEVNAAVDLLIDWKKNLAKFESEQYKNGIANAEYLIVHGYNGDILQVMQEKKDIAFEYPKEGVMLSMDLMVIPKDAPNRDLAHAFINFLLEDAIAAENMAFTFFLSPNSAAYAMLPENLRNNTSLFPPADVMKKVELIRDLGEQGLIYNKGWDRLKSER